jgi:hypothetical protein
MLLNYFKTEIGLNLRIKLSSNMWHYYDTHTQPSVMHDILLPKGFATYVGEILQLPVFLKLLNFIDLNVTTNMRLNTGTSSASGIKFQTALEHEPIY